MDIVTKFFLALIAAINGNGDINFRPKTNAAALASEFETRCKQLSPDQVLVLEEILFNKSNCVVVTGKAGSGKSFLLQLLADMLNTLFDLKCVKTSPTGINAVSIGGQTVNSLFKMGAGDLLPFGIKDNGARGVYQRKSVAALVKNARETFSKGRDAVVIIDEAFCCSSELLVLVCQLMLKVNPNTKFILVGDPAQLPPVDRKEDNSLKQVNKAWNSAKFITQSGEEHTYHSILEGAAVEPNPNWVCTKMALTTNHRQGEDKEFANALNYLAMGGGLEGPAKYLEKRFINKVQPTSYEQALHIYPSVAKVAALNQEAINNAIASGAEWRNYPTYSEWVGARNEGLVMAPLAIGMPFMVRLNLDNGLSNGSRGTIVQLNNDNIVVKFGAKNLTLPLTEFKYGPIGRDGYPEITIMIIPGHLSCAITGHKVQGLTIDGEVVLHLDSKDRYLKYQPGWLYVCCSRTRRPEQLFIDSSITVFNEIATASEDALDFRASCHKTFIKGDITPSDVMNMNPVLFDTDLEQGLYQFTIWTPSGEQADLVYSQTTNDYLFYDAGSDEAQTIAAVDCAHHELCMAIIKQLNTLEPQQEETISLEEYLTEEKDEFVFSNLDKVCFMEQDGPFYNFEAINANDAQTYEFTFDENTGYFLFGDDEFIADDFPYAATALEQVAEHRKLVAANTVKVAEVVKEVEPVQTTPDVEEYSLISYDLDTRTASILCTNQTQGTELLIGWDDKTQMFSIGKIQIPASEFPGQKACSKLCVDYLINVLREQSAEHRAMVDDTTTRSGVELPNYEEMNYNDISGDPYPTGDILNAPREVNFYGDEGQLGIPCPLEDRYIVKGDMSEYRTIRVGRTLIQLIENELTYKDGYLWAGQPCSIEDRNTFAWVVTQNQYRLLIKDKGLVPGSTDTYDISEFSKWLLSEENVDAYNSFKERCTGSINNNFFGCMLASGASYKTPESLTSMTMKVDGVNPVAAAISQELTFKGVTPEVVELTYKATKEIENSKRAFDAIAQYNSVEHQTLLKEEQEGYALTQTLLKKTLSKFEQSNEKEQITTQVLEEPTTQTLTLGSSNSEVFSFDASYDPTLDDESVESLANLFAELELQEQPLEDEQPKVDTTVRRAHPDVAVSAHFKPYVPKPILKAKVEEIAVSKEVEVITEEVEVITPIEVEVQLPSTEEIFTVPELAVDVKPEAIVPNNDLLLKALALVEATAKAASQAAEQARIAAEHAATASAAALEATEMLRTLLTPTESTEVATPLVQVDSKALEVSTVYEEEAPDYTSVYIGGALGTQKASALAPELQVDKTLKGVALKQSHQEVVDQYTKFLNKNESHPLIKEELNSIVSLLKQGKTVRLKCYCKTTKNALAMHCEANEVPCHGDVIKNYVLNNLL